MSDFIVGDTDADAAAERRWQQWRARGAADSRRSARTMRGVLAVGYVAAIIVILAQLI